MTSPTMIGSKMTSAKMTNSLLTGSVMSNSVLTGSVMSNSVLTSSVINKTYDKPEYHCFEMPVRSYSDKNHWYFRWHSQFNDELKLLNEQEKEKLAELIPLLLCGEQSAIVTFHQHANRPCKGSINTSKKLFSQIESDEAFHEHALQNLLSALPQPDNLHQLKRRSQQFYLSLSKNVSLAEQFCRISQLDSNVCLIMHAMSKSRLARLPAMAFLFSSIMKDEARHVSISRKHASQLGITRDQIEIQSWEVKSKLVKLLATMEDCFEYLQVEPSILFRKISGAR